MKNFLHLLQTIYPAFHNLKVRNESFGPGRRLASILDLTKLMRRYAGAVLMVTATLSAAQGQNTPGALDPGFNTGDVTIGQGEGVNLDIRTIAIQNDGRIIVGGGFNIYNRTIRNRIARLNSDGSLDESFFPGNGFDNNVESIALQSDGKVVAGGNFTSYNGTALSRIARLNPDGTQDAAFIPGAGFDSQVLAVALQSDGRILAGGNFTSYNGTASNRIIRLNADGSLDTSFNPGTGFSDIVNAIALQSDGKVVIGGAFMSFNGEFRNRIVRLNPDGSVDNSFDTGGGFNGAVESLAVQSEGKIVVGGDFAFYNGTGRNRIARLNSDGTLDASFDPGTGLSSGTVESIALQSDGRVVVGGEFAFYNGIDRNRIARLNADGSLDNSFNPGTGFNARVYSVALQRDGKIVIGGMFSSYNGTGRNRIVRLHADGVWDISFNPGAGFNNYVNDMVIQPDGKVVVGGIFDSYNNFPSSRIARLNTDGTLDASFSTGTAFNGAINSIVRQPDGKLVVGGVFTSYNGVARNRIARLHADGTLDHSFDPGTGFNSTVRAIALQSDGKVVAGGQFTTFNGTSRNRIVRLNTDGSLDTTFEPGAGFITSGEVVWTVAVQSNNKVLVGGDLSSYNGAAIHNFVRLNTDGSQDDSFNSGTGVNGRTQFITLQPDDKIILTGGFTLYNGQPHNRIVRLNVDGSPDDSFSAGTGLTSSGQAIALQSDGKLVIGGGNYTSSTGVVYRGIVRLNANGSLDTSFNPGTGFSHAVHTLALQSDGKVVVAGNFTSFNNIPRTRIARLYGGEGPVLSAAIEYLPGLDVLVYPNPAQGAINLQFSEAEALVGTAKLSLYDAMGGQVLTREVAASEGQTGIKLTTAGLAGGVYFLKISTRSGIVTKRVVLAE